MQQFTLPLVAGSLSLLGLVTLASVSPELMQRQLLFVFASFLVFWFVARIPIKSWWNWGDWLWKGLVVVLVGLLIFGRATRGAVAWLDLGWGLRFQPSQFALLATCLVAIPKFSKKQILSDQKLLQLFWLIGAPLLLILLQPDFGTAFLYGAAASLLVFWQKIPKQYWRIGGAVLFFAAVIGWNFVLKPYQRARITSFMAGSQADTSDAGYNARQSLVAVGSGQLFGKGIGHGTQSQLRFLPERQTDFIFASLAEEWGLVGSLVVISLYAYLIQFLLKQAARMGDPQESLLILVIAVYFLTQVFVNIGMNIGLLPITGVTLPLVS